MNSRPQSFGLRPSCTGKRRYRTQGDALDGALLAGVERSRSAYLCPECGYWHLTSRGPGPSDRGRRKPR